MNARSGRLALLLLLGACASSRTIVVNGVRYVYEPQTSAQERIGKYVGAVAPGTAISMREHRAAIVEMLGEPRLVRVRAYDRTSFASFEDAARHLDRLLRSSGDIANHIYWSQGIPNVVIAELELAAGPVVSIECGRQAVHFRDEDGTAWWTLVRP